MSIGPCQPYASPGELIAARLCDFPTDDPDKSAQALALVTNASQILYLLLGRQFPGSCTTTLRPVARHGRGSSFVNPLGLTAPWQPNGYFPFYGQGYCYDSITIPYGGTVTGADKITVKIGGEGFTAFALMDGDKLIRTDGQEWPCCQDIRLPDTEPGTWSITLPTFGPATPSIVKPATLELAAELWRLVPVEVTGLDRATAINREGVSIQQQPDRVLQLGNGPALPTVQMAVATWNPTGARLPSTVWSPDATWVLHEIIFPS